MPLIAIVFVTYNSGGCVGEALASVRSTLPGSEVIVVDNASTDGSVDIAEQQGADRVIALQRNIGFGSACNVGARAASRRHVLFANPDVMLEDARYQELAAQLGAERLGLLVPALVGPAGRDRSEPQIFREHHWLKDCISLAIGPLLPRELRTPARVATEDASVWAGAALLMVRKAEFFNLGGFDQRFFLYYEDRELSRRYRRAGLPIRGTTALTGRHVGGGSSALQGPRTEPQAWAVLGWLQYVCIAQGIATARRSWHLTAVLMDLVRFVVGATSRVLRTQRLLRKFAELREVENALRLIALTDPPGPESFCPDARAIVAAHATRSEGAASRADSSGTMP